MQPSSSKAVSRNVFLRTLAFSLPVLSSIGTKAAEATSTPSTPPVPDLANLRTFVELARSDIRTQKAVLVAENISFTSDEAIDFWPLHREYELELSKLQDARIALIKQYASQYDSMTDADAEKLALAVFDLESQRTSLKRKYFKKFSKVIPPKKAARFFQIENQLNMVLDLQVAAALPLIK